jgi:hypothetical protein
VIQGGIAYSNGVAKSIDFRLDPITGGGTISGHLEDNLGNKLSNVPVIIYSTNGEYLAETRTDLNGDYESNLLANDSYHVRAFGATGGLQAELYDDRPCTIGCNDPSFITSGDAVPVNNGPTGGIDFVLEKPLSNVITGFVTDAALGTPMPDVWIGLFNDTGNWLDAETFTAPDGSYQFSGLPDGSYKVYTSGVPENYSGVLYNGVICPDWSCDFGSEGTSVPVSGSVQPVRLHGRAIV